MRTVETNIRQLESIASRGSGPLSGFFATVARGAFQFGIAAFGISAVAESIATLGNSLLGANAQWEAYTTRFVTLEGSVQGAQNEMQKLFDYAARTPFQITQVADADRLLTVFGMHGDQLTKTLTQVGNAAAVSGRDFSQVALQVGRAYSAIQAGLPAGRPLFALQQFGVISGTTRQQLDAMTKAGANATDIWNVFSNALDRFSIHMALMQRTMHGMLTTVADLGQLLVRNITLPFFNLAESGLRNLLGDIVNDVTDDSRYANAKIHELDNFTKGVGASVQHALNDTLANLSLAAQILAPPLTKLFTDIRGAFVANFSGFGQIANSAFLEFLTAARLALDRLAPAISEVAQRTIIAFSTSFQSVGPSLESIVDVVSQALARVISEVGFPLVHLWLTYVAQIVLGIKQIAPAVSAVVETAAPVVANLINWFATLIPSAVQVVVNLVNSVLAPAVRDLVLIFDEQLYPALSRTADFIFSRLNTAVGTLSTIWQDIRPTVQNVVTVFTDNLLPAAEKVADWFISIWPGAIALASNFVNNFLLPALKDVADIVTNTLLPIFQRLWDMMATIGPHVIASLASAWRQLSALFVGLANVIGNVILPPLIAFGGFFSKILQGPLLIVIGLIGVQLVSGIMRLANVLLQQLIPGFLRVGGMIAFLKPQLQAFYDVLSRPTNVGGQGLNGLALQGAKLSATIQFVIGSARNGLGSLLNLVDAGITKGLNLTGKALSDLSTTTIGKIGGIRNALQATGWGLLTVKLPTVGPSQWIQGQLTTIMQAQADASRAELRTLQENTARAIDLLTRRQQAEQRTGQIIEQIDADIQRLAPQQITLMEKRYQIEENLARLEERVQAAGTRAAARGADPVLAQTRQRTALTTQFNKQFKAVEALMLEETKLNITGKNLVNTARQQTDVLNIQGRATDQASKSYRSYNTQLAITAQRLQAETQAANFLRGGPNLATGIQAQVLSTARIGGRTIDVTRAMFRQLADSAGFASIGIEGLTDKQKRNFIQTELNADSFKDMATSSKLAALGITEDSLKETLAAQKTAIGFAQMREAARGFLSGVQNVGLSLTFISPLLAGLGPNAQGLSEALTTLAGTITAVSFALDALLALGPAGWIITFIAAVGALVFNIGGARDAIFGFFGDLFNANRKLDQQLASEHSWADYWANQVSIAGKATDTLKGIINDQTNYISTHAPGASLLGGQTPVQTPNTAPTSSEIMSNPLNYGFTSRSRIDTQQASNEQVQAASDQAYQAAQNVAKQINESWIQGALDFANSADAQDPKILASMGGTPEEITAIKNGTYIKLNEIHLEIQAAIDAQTPLGAEKLRQHYIKLFQSWAPPADAPQLLKDAMTAAHQRLLQQIVSSIVDLNTQASQQIQMLQDLLTGKLSGQQKEAALAYAASLQIDLNDPTVNPAEVVAKQYIDTGNLVQSILAEQGADFGARLHAYVKEHPGFTPPPFIKWDETDEQARQQRDNFYASAQANLKLYSDSTAFVHQNLLRLIAENPNKDIFKKDAGGFFPTLKPDEWKLFLNEQKLSMDDLITIYDTMTGNAQNKIRDIALAHTGLPDILQTPAFKFSKKVLDLHASDQSSAEAASEAAKNEETAIKVYATIAKDTVDAINNVTTIFGQLQIFKAPDLKAVGKQLSDFIDALDVIFEPIQKKAVKYEKDIDAMSKLVDAYSKIFDALQKAADFVSTFNQNLGGWLADTATLSQNVSDFADFTIKVFVQMYETFRKNATVAKLSDIQVIQTVPLVGALGTALGEIFGGLGAALDFLIKLTTTGQAITNNTLKVAIAMANFGALINLIIAKMKDIILPGTQELAAGLAKGLGDIGTIFKSLSDVLDFFIKLSENGRKVFGQVKNWTSWMLLLSTEIVVVVAAFKLVADHVASELTKQTTDAADGLASVFKGMSDVLDFFTKLSENGRKMASKQTDWTVWLGYLADGAKEGVDAFKKIVPDTFTLDQSVKDYADEVDSAFKAFDSVYGLMEKLAATGKKTFKANVDFNVAVGKLADLGKVGVDDFQQIVTDDQTQAANVQAWGAATGAVFDGLAKIYDLAQKMATGANFVLAATRTLSIHLGDLVSLSQGVLNGVKGNADAMADVSPAISAYGAAISSIFDGLSKAYDLMVSLSGTGQAILSQAGQLSTMIQEIRKVVAGVMKEAFKDLANVSSDNATDVQNYGSATSTLFDALAKAYDFFLKLIDTATKFNTSSLKFVNIANTLNQKMLTIYDYLLQITDPTGTTGAGWYGMAESVGKLAGAFSNIFDALNKAFDFFVKIVDSGQILDGYQGKLVNDTNAFLDEVVAVAKHFQEATAPGGQLPVFLDGVNAAATTTGDIFGALGTALDFFLKLIDAQEKLNSASATLLPLTTTLGENISKIMAQWQGMAPPTSSSEAGANGKGWDYDLINMFAQSTNAVFGALSAALDFFLKIVNVSQRILGPASVVVGLTKQLGDRILEVMTNFRAMVPGSGTPDNGSTKKWDYTQINLFADATQKVFAALTTSYDYFIKVATTGTYILASIDSIVTFTNTLTDKIGEVIGAFAKLVDKLKGQILDVAELGTYAQNASSVISALSAIFDLFLKFAQSGDVVLGNMTQASTLLDDLTASIDGIMLKIVAIVQNPDHPWDTTLSQQVGAFGVAVGQVIDGLVKTVTFLNTLSVTTTAFNSAPILAEIDALREGVLNIMIAMEKVSTDPRLQGQTANISALAESVTKSVDAIQATMTLFTSLSVYRTNAASLEAGVDSIISAIDYIMGAIRDKIGSKYAAATGAAGYATNLADTALKVVQTLTSTMTFFEGLVGRSFDYSKIQATVSQIVTGIKDILDQIKTQLGAAFQDTGQAALADSVSKLITALTSGFDLLKTLGTNVSKLASDIQVKELARQVVATFVDFKTELEVQIKELDPNAFVLTANSFGTVADNISKVLTAVTDGFTLLKTVGSSVTTLASSTQVKDLVSKVVGVFLDFKAELEAQVNELEPESFATISTSFGTVADNVNKVLTTLSSGFTLLKTVGTNVSRLASSIQVKGLVSQIVGVFLSFKTELETRLSALDPDAFAITAGLFGTIADNIAKVLAALKDGLDLLTQLEGASLTIGYLDPLAFLSPFLDDIAKILAGFQAKAADIAVQLQGPVLDDAANLSKAFSGLKDALDFMIGLFNYRPVGTGRIDAFFASFTEVLNRMSDLSGSITDQTRSTAEKLGADFGPAFAALKNALDIFKALSGESSTETSVDTKRSGQTGRTQTTSGTKTTTTAGFLKPVNPAAVRAFVSSLVDLLQELDRQMSGPVVQAALAASQHISATLGPAMDAISKAVGVFTALMGDDTTETTTDRQGRRSRTSVKRTQKGSILGVTQDMINQFIGDLTYLLTKWAQIVNNPAFGGDFQNKSDAFAGTVENIVAALTDTMNAMQGASNLSQGGSVDISKIFKDLTNGFTSFLNQITPAVAALADPNSVGSVVSMFVKAWSLDQPASIPNIWRTAWTDMAQTVTQQVTAMLQQIALLPPGTSFAGLPGAGNSQNPQDQPGGNQDDGKTRRGTDHGGLRVNTSGLGDLTRHARTTSESLLSLLNAPAFQSTAFASGGSSGSGGGTVNIIQPTYMNDTQVVAPNLQRELQVTMRRQNIARRGGNVRGIS